MKRIPVLLVAGFIILPLIIAACVTEVERESAFTPLPPPTATVPTSTPPPASPTARPPTSTPRPTATMTPAPTATLMPTATPVLTPTPEPTATPKPTPVPAPLPERDSGEIPHVFVGDVTVDGAAAPEGTEVAVWVIEFDSPLATSTTAEGSYSLLVFQHGGASFRGKTLIFKINGQDSGEVGSWQRGGGTILNLSLE